MRVWLNIRENSFGVDSVCDEIVSPYARPVNSITFVKDLKGLIKIQVSTRNNQNFENPPKKQSISTKMNIKKLDTSQQTLVPRMLSHRENVRTSKFWQKTKERNRIFFKY